MNLQGNAAIESASELAAEVVRTFGEVRLRVFGTSMVPSILPGDLVSIHRAGVQDISPGEVVLFFRHGRLFVHRVVDRQAAVTTDSPGEPRLITRGDRLRQDDPAVSSSELLGRVVSIERDNQRIEFQARRANPMMVRMLQSSEGVTSLYLRLAAFWRTLALRRVKCQA
jgi:signal peptidase I